MNNDEIKITKDDLHSEHVEEILEKQAALLGDLDYLHRNEGEKPKTSIFMSSWFYLLIAGLMGALIAWLILEPHYEDSKKMTGVISSIQTDVTFDNSSEKLSVVTVGAVKFVVYEQTFFAGKTASGEKVTSEAQLETGQYVTVAYESIRNGYAGAAGIKVSPTPLPKTEPPKEDPIKDLMMHFLIFSIVGAFIGLFVGAADGILSRTYLKAVKAGLIGAVIGFIGGLISTIIGGIVYSVVGLITMSMKLDPFNSAVGFISQVARRAFAWMVLGMTMGLGQGIALKSKKLLLNGFLGGLIGGLLGGLLFDPIDILWLSKGVADPFRQAAVSRGVGICLTGAFVGLMIGIVEQMSKDAWLVMTEGPIKGKQFIIYRDITRVGSSPDCEIYLFKDPEIEPHHAEIQKIHDGYIIRDKGTAGGIYYNDKRVREAKLRDNDRITIGKASFTFSERERD